MARGPKRRLVLAALVAVALVASACGDDDGGGDDAAATTAAPATTSGTTGGSTASSEPNEASAPGITEDRVLVGGISSATGPASSLYQNVERTFEARFALENERGGVHGRELELRFVDDASNPTQNLSAVQSLVNNDKVFAVLSASAFLFGSFRFLQEQGVPVIGSATDGNEWYLEPNTNMVSTGGNGSPNRPQYTGAADFIKSLDGTRVGSLGYGQSPSSSDAAKKFHEFAVPAAGLEPAYLNVSIPFGSVDVGTIVLDMKNANVDSLYLPLIDNTNLAIVTAAKQNDMELVAPILVTGYGQNILDQPTAREAGQDAYFQSQYRPIELENEGTLEMVDALKRFADFEGVPDYAMYTAWLAADLFIEGLKAAEQNPTRESYLDALHGLGTYDGGGLLPRDVDISLEGFGKPQPEACSWYMQLKGSEFVPVPPSGEPVCGRLIPESDR